MESFGAWWCTAPCDGSLLALVRREERRRSGTHLGVACPLSENLSRKCIHPFYPVQICPCTQARSSISCWIFGNILASNRWKKQKEHVDCPVPLGICRWLSSCSPIVHHHCSISSLVVWSHTDTEEIHWKSPKAVMNPTCDQSRTVRIIGTSFVIDFMQLLEHFCMERHSEGSEALRSWWFSLHEFLLPVLLLRGAVLLIITKSG